jgi:hypothetical protein
LFLFFVTLFKKKNQFLDVFNLSRIFSLLTQSSSVATLTNDKEVVLSLKTQVRTLFHPAHFSKSSTTNASTRAAQIELKIKHSSFRQRLFSTLLYNSWINGR